MDTFADKYQYGQLYVSHLWTSVTDHAVHGGGALLGVNCQVKIGGDWYCPDTIVHVKAFKVAAYWSWSGHSLGLPSLFSTQPHNIH